MVNTHWKSSYYYEGYYYFLILNFLPEDMFLGFLERERERKKKNTHKY